MEHEAANNEPKSSRSKTVRSARVSLSLLSLLLRVTLSRFSALPLLWGTN